MVYDIDFVIVFLIVYVLPENMPRSNKKSNGAGVRPPAKLNLLSKIPSSTAIMKPPDSTQLMIRRAISSGSHHGINLDQGRMNKGDGDCAFESVLYNNNDRECFTEKYTFSIDYYRRIWMTDMQSKSMNNPDWNLSYSPETLWQGFEEMKQTGVYERDFFGDMMLPAIAVGVHKIILVFNTNIDSPHDPISVISAANFGGYVDSDIPIVLAYNLSHFESMHPVSLDDR